jgi:hypothetical protein
MNQPLRPMNLGEILDRTFQIYRSRFVVFVGIAALPELVMTAIELANQFWWKMTPDPNDRRIFLWYSPIDLLYSIVLAQGRVLFSLLLFPAFALVTSKSIFGESYGLVASLSKCFKRWGQLIGLTATNWSLQLLAPEAVVAGLFLGTVYLMFEVFNMDQVVPPWFGPWMIVAAMAIGFATFQWTASTIALSEPTWAIEEMRIGSAIRRAFKLSKGSRWRIVIARVVPLIINWTLVTLITEIIFLLLFFVFRHFAERWFSHLDLLNSIAILTQGAVAAVVGPIYPITLTLIYYDQRIRKEGYDIEQMMQTAGWTTDIVPASQPLPGREALPEAQA